MKHLLTTYVSAVLLAALGLCREARAQEQGDKALQRAKVIEEQEGDLRAAETAYQGVIDAAGIAAGVRTEAMLRLGRMWWRLGREPEAKAMLQRVQQAGGEAGAAAAVILQGQGPEAQAAEEVAARARDAIARFLGEKPPTGNAEQDLQWLGSAAIPEILRQLTTRRAMAVQLAAQLSSSDQKYLYDEALGLGTQQPGNPTFQQHRGAMTTIRNLARQAWRIGGPEVERFLRSALADEDVQWRRLIASGSQSVGDALLPLVTQMLKDADPQGYVPIFALGSADRLPLEAVVATLAAPVAEVRSRAWTAVDLLALWKQGAMPPKDEAVRLIEPHLLKALGDNDPATARAAFAILRVRVAVTARGGELLLDWLPRIPVFDRSGAATPPMLKLTSIVRAARSLGAFGTADGKDDRRQFLASIADLSVRSEPARTVAQICDLVELGYDHAQMVNWLAQAVVLAGQTSTDDLARIVGLLDRCAQPAEVARALIAIDLTPAAYPGLAKRLLDLLARVGDSGPGQANVTVGRGRGRRPPDTATTPVSDAERASVEEANLLFEAVGRTHSPQVVAFLRQQLASSPAWATSISRGALGLSDGTAGVDALLRELLVHGSIDAGNRNLVFAELAKHGDVEAIALFPKAYELGLKETSRDQGVRPLRGAQWLSTLMAWPPGQNAAARPIRKLHGYDDAQLTSAWHVLLDSPAMPDVLVDALMASWGDGRLLDLSSSVWLQIAELLGRRLPELLQQFNKESPGSSQLDSSGRGTLRQIVERVAAQTPLGDDANSQRYRAAVQKMLANEELGAFVATHLSRGAMLLLADSVRPLLGGRSALEVLLSMRGAGVKLTADDLLVGLRNEHQNRESFLLQVPLDAPAEIVRELETLVRNADPKIRAAACAQLGYRLSPDSIAVLLPALRDPIGDVRKAASEALQEIRQYQEQRAFWDQFQEGVGTGRESATAKLLIQSKPGANKEQRLLALRSLGALGAPEALPYLIEWSQEPDADVAAACKAAIARIHQQAGVK